MNEDVHDSLEKKVNGETRSHSSDYCLGHITHAIIPQWCPHCRYDERNRQCLGYTPIKHVLYNVVSEKETSREGVSH